MPEAFWTLLATAVGGFIGWATSNVQVAHQSRLEARSRFIERMERLHDVLTQLSRQCSTMQSMVLIKLGYNNSKIEPPDERVNLGPMHMLVDFYAPALKPEATEISLAVDKLSAALFRSLMEANLTAKRKEELMIVAVEAGTRAVNQVNRAKEKLALIVNPHAQIPEAPASLADRLRRHTKHAGQWPGQWFRKAKPPA